MSCFADAQLDISISSSICADVASQVYKLDHVFQVLLLDCDRLVGFGIEPRDLGLPNIYPEASVTEGRLYWCIVTY